MVRSSSYNRSAAPTLEGMELTTSYSNSAKEGTSSILRERGIGFTVHARDMHGFQAGTSTEVCH
jgi:hypothetical protein